MVSALADKSDIRKKIVAYPFVKWAGGKRQLINEYRKYFPLKGSYITYFEPFLGGGAVFFDLQPEKAILMDINEELINAYKVIQSNLEGLILELKRHKENHCEKYYYQVRNWDRLPDYKDRTPEEKAGRFIYLNRTCFNGLYRVNRNGHNNVPIGRYKNPKILDRENLINVHELLDGDKDIRIINTDYKEVLKYAEKGDFVYFDPPYYPLDDTSFTSYTKNDFGPEDHEKLAEVFMELHKRGCKVALSNSSAEEVYKLYDYDGIDIIPLYARRSINSNSNGRGSIKELLIINYGSELKNK